MILITLKAKATGRTPRRLEGVLKIPEIKYPAVCAICFRNENIPLIQCLFSTNKYNASNCETHIKKKHSQCDAPAIFDARETKVMSSVQIEAISTITSPDKSSGSIYSFVSNYSTNDALSTFHQKLYKFMNSSGTSIRQGMNPHLQDLFRFIAENGAVLKKNPASLNMSRHKYVTEQYRSFARTIYVVQSIIEMTRKYYKEETGSYQPFLYVSHDIWDTKKNSVLGVSIHFIVPIIWTMEQFPVGLSSCTSHKAVDVLDETNKILARYVNTYGIFCIADHYLKNLLFKLWCDSAGHISGNQ